MKRTKLAIVIVFVVLLALQAITAQARVVNPWSRIYEGIEYATGSDTVPRNMLAYALRVDLWNPNVQLYASHDNGGASKEVTTEKVGTFLWDHNCKVGVNASYCDVTSSTTTPTNVDIWGLGISDGVVVSPGATTRGAQYNCQMLFTAAKAASIVLSQTTPTGIHTAVTGNAYHLVNGTALGATTGPTARTSFGLSADNRYLIMVCVNGSGATILDMSYWMLDFGAWNAINMDGGGSTCMARADIGNVNVPVANERLVGVHLGARSINTTYMSATSMNANRMDIVKRGPSNNPMIRTWTSSGGWGSWVNLGGTTYYTPAIVSRYDGRLDLFCIGTDHALYHGWFNGGSWSGWAENLGGVGISAPAVSRRDANTMDIAVRGYYSDVQYISWNSSTGWSGWSSLGGTTYDGPGIGSFTPGSLNVYVRGTDNQCYTKYIWNGNWTSWASMGGNISSAPVASSLYADNIMLFARNQNGGLGQNWWGSGPGWSGWLDLGGYFVGAPAVTCRDANHCDVFVRAGDDQIYQNSWYVWSGWSGFVPMGETY